MTAEQLFSEHTAQPFKPFVINLADGRSYIVDHPEVLGCVPGARIAAVWNRTAQAWSQLDVSLMTGLDPYMKPRSKPRRRAN